MASQLSISAPSCISNKDTVAEPRAKVARMNIDSATNPFVSALLAEKEEAQKHASKVTVLDKIPPPSGSSNSHYCMWNIDENLKEIIDIYFRSCMDDKSHAELAKQFPKPDVPALHIPELDKWLILIQGKHLQVTERNYMGAAGLLCILLQHLKTDPGCSGR